MGFMVYKPTLNQQTSAGGQHPVDDWPIFNQLITPKRFSEDVTVLFSGFIAIGPMQLWSVLFLNYRGCFRASTFWFHTGISVRQYGKASHCDRSKPFDGSHMLYPHWTCFGIYPIYPHVLVVLHHLPGVLGKPSIFSFSCWKLLPVDMAINSLFFPINSPCSPQKIPIESPYIGDGCHGCLIFHCKIPRNEMTNPKRTSIAKCKQSGEYPG